MESPGSFWGSIWDGLALAELGLLLLDRELATSFLTAGLCVKDSESPFGVMGAGNCQNLPGRGKIRGL